ncbi:MAG: type II toxin-antitoxin system RelE/ParE family toxin [Candidatus Poribacteria bacterium]|nr:type II toxin-antitoxin system RelE/ParE family toxin [Candidatus Poribacteria bacterium]
MYEVVFFSTRSGREPVRDWLNTLAEHQKKTVFKDISLVASQFPKVLRRSLLRKMKGHKDIWEIRTRLDKVSVRIFFLEYDFKIILLHYIYKKTRKTPSKDLNIVGNRRREYLLFLDRGDHEKK